MKADPEERGRAPHARAHARRIPPLRRRRRRSSTRPRRSARPPQRVSGRARRCFMATGRYDEAREAHAADRGRQPATAMVTTAVLAGAHAEARGSRSALFERARTVDRRRLPVPGRLDGLPARARCSKRAGKEKQARAYYLEALEAIPVYVHAAVHAASTDTPERAIERLEALRTVTTDPDVLAALADAHKRAKHDAEAKKATDAARARYAELLAKHPEAYRRSRRALLPRLGQRPEEGPRPRREEREGPPHRGGDRSLDGRGRGRAAQGSDLRVGNRDEAAAPTPPSRGSASPQPRPATARRRRRRK